MEAFVLHYTPLIQRKNHMIEECKRANINPIFIETYDRENLTEIDTFRFDSSIVSLSKISLMLKHIEAWRRISENDRPYGIILEDDVFFCPDFLNIFSKYMEEIPHTFDVVMINSGCELSIPAARIEEDRHIYRKGLEPTSWGGDGGTRCTDAYLISKKCASQYVQYYESLTKSMIQKQADFWINDIMRFYQSEVYWAEPSIVRQGSLFGIFETSL